MYNTDQSSYWKRADATIRSLHFEVLKNLQTAARNAYFRMVFQSTFFSSTCPLLFHSQDMSFIRSNGHFPFPTITTYVRAVEWITSIHPSIFFNHTYNTYHTIHVIHITTIYFLRLAPSINPRMGKRLNTSLPFPSFFSFLALDFWSRAFFNMRELYPYRTEKSWVIFKFEICYLGAHYFRWPFGSPSAFRSFSWCLTGSTPTYL